MHMKQNVLHRINGFFGSIGPNMNVTQKTTLFDLFTADGIVQGVFFDKGKIYPVKHLIETDKVLYEREHGQVGKGFWNALLHMLMHHMKLMPNMMGTANTAMLNITPFTHTESHVAFSHVNRRIPAGFRENRRKNRVFALFERDIPYELAVDFENKEIKTMGKVNTNMDNKFSGHSKYDAANDIVHTIDYNIFTKTVTYYKMNSKLDILCKFSKTMNYLPIIHDFLVLDSGDILVIDSPLKLWMRPIPISFRKDLPTYIHIMGPNEKTYVSESGFYCFHYAGYKETATSIEIYAPLYENLDFNSLDIQGKYRGIIIYKNSGTVYIKRNPLLEPMNLDFPISYGDSVILRRIIDRRIGGYVVCRGLDIERVIDLPHAISVYGEHVITKVDGKAYLMALCKNGFLLVLGLENNDMVYTKLFDEGVTLGFHSIFMGG